MAGPRDLAPLVRLSGMVLDAELARVRRAAAARDASLAALAALALAPSRPDDDISPIATAQAGLRYQRWADARRAEINIRLARQTAEWMTRRAEAATAFGRAEALRSLHDRAAEAARKRRR